MTVPVSHPAPPLSSALAAAAPDTAAQAAARAAASPLLEVAGLRVDYGDPRAPLRAVDGIDLRLDRGEVLALVGESGCGKSTAALGLMGLVAWPGRVHADTLRFDGEDLLSATPRRRRALSGAGLSMVFQDPASSLNPAYTVGAQITEALRIHDRCRGRRALRERAAELLAQVGIADPAARLDAWPHQLSGGMNQRVMIAMAIACSPRLLIADEPTTALDVTIQAQIMDLLLDLKRRQGMALLLISHDLALVSMAAQRVAVMYCGRIVECGPAWQVLGAPRHPYTAALLAALPERARGRRLAAIGGTVPGLGEHLPGCAFAPRCPRARPRCQAEEPRLEQGVRCFFPLESG